MLLLLLLLLYDHTKAAFTLIRVHIHPGFCDVIHNIHQIGLCLMNFGQKVEFDFDASVDETIVLMNDVVHLTA